MMRCYNVHAYHGGLDITLIHYYDLIYDTDCNDIPCRALTFFFHILFSCTLLATYTRMDIYSFIIAAFSVEALPGPFNVVAGTNDLIYVILLPKTLLLQLTKDCVQYSRPCKTSGDGRSSASRGRTVVAQGQTPASPVSRSRALKSPAGHAFPPSSTSAFNCLSFLPCSLFLT